MRSAAIVDHSNGASDDTSMSMSEGENEDSVERIFKNLKKAQQQGNKDEVPKRRLELLKYVQNLSKDDFK